MFHCYKKCASVKNGGGEDGMVSTKRPVMTIDEAAPIVAGQMRALDLVAVIMTDPLLPSPSQL